MNVRTPSLLLAVLLLAPGCGYGLLQTARTTPAGHVDVQVGGGLLMNELADERGYGSANLPIELGARVGLSDRVDIGGRFFLGPGGLVDAKVGLLDPASRLALAVDVGIGAANDLGGTGPVFHIPVSVIASYDLAEHLVPYASVGWGSFWIFSRRPNLRPGSDIAVASTGSGEGVVMLTAGLEIPVGPAALVGEYRFWKPVLDDPGDGFAFVDENLVLVGLRLRVP